MVLAVHMTQLSYRLLAACLQYQHDIYGDIKGEDIHTILERVEMSPALIYVDTPKASHSPDRMAEARHPITLHGQASWNRANHR